MAINSIWRALIQDTTGYNMEIKFQLPRPSVPGMPKGPSSTIIRNNVFIKGDQPSPDGDRPNVLVGGFPDSGPGSNDLYEIYGNFFDHNPRQSLRGWAIRSGDPAESGFAAQARLRLQQHDIHFAAGNLFGQPGANNRRRYRQPGVRRHTDLRLD